MARESPGVIVTSFFPEESKYIFEPIVIIGGDVGKRLVR
jgi:hypothetical protein